MKDEDGKEIKHEDPFPFNIKFKRHPMAEWETWMFLPPTDKTIAILKREVKANIAEMKEEGRFAVKRVYTVFFGHCVYAFKFLDGKEVYLDD